MPPQLLPASAAAFAPRASSVNVVLGNKVEPWVTQTLKRINRIKRPLNSVAQHQRCLTETLSSKNAIWTLASLMVAKKPEAELHTDPNPLVEALHNYQLITVEAYIVHVDMVLRNEVAFKLTPDTIEVLIQHHKNVHCVDAKAKTYDWAEKEQQCKKLQNDFVQAINRYVFRTHVSALEGLEEDGAGELLCGKSDEVKTNIFNMFKPLLPPPPKVVDVFRQPPLLPSNANVHANVNANNASTSMSNYWAQQAFGLHSPSNAQAMAAAAAAATAAAIAATAAHVSSAMPAPVEPWRVLSSSPNIPTTTAVDMGAVSHLWAGMGMGDINDIHDLHQHSPSPPYSQPYSTAPLFYGDSFVTAPIPQLPLPSMLAPQCGVSVGYNSFGWDRFQDFATI